MVALVAVTLFSIMSLGLVAFWRERAALEKQLSDELTASVNYTEQRLADWLRERQSDVHFLAADSSNRESFYHLLNPDTPPAQKQLHRSRLTASLVSMQQARPEYQRIILADTTGKIIVAADPAAVGRTVLNKAAFSQTLALANATPVQSYSEDISYDERLGKYIMCFGYPLLAPTDVLLAADNTPPAAIGVVLIVVDVETTVFQILEGWSKGDSGAAVLSRAEGDKTRILNQVFKDPARPLERLLPPPPDLAQARPSYWAARGVEDDMRFTIDHLQVEVLTAYRYIEAMKWGLVLKMDTSEIFAPLHDLVRHVIYIALGVLAVALLVSILTARTLTRPLAALVADARAVVAGQTPTYTTLQRQDEIGLLARSLREMVDALHHQQQQLKAANEVAGGILSSRPVDEILQDVVQAAQRLTGATAAQFKVAVTVNQPAVRVIQSQRLVDEWAPVMAPVVQPGYAPLLSTYMRQERQQPFPAAAPLAGEKATIEMSLEAPYLFNPRNHTAIPVSLQGDGLGTLWVQKAGNQPFSTADTDTLQALSTYAAVALANSRLVQRLQSWNTELEQKVEERTRRLEAANQQLLVLDKMKSDLLYSISHELRNPISNLKLQLDLLNHHIDSPRREKYLGLLANQVNMLGSLVIDMLELIQIDSAQDQVVFTTIDFNHLVADVVSACTVRLQETKKPIALHFTPCPTPALLHGEQKHLSLAIAHLLRNALNFTDQGEISVAIMQDAKGICLQIKDTGVGIAESDLPYIFDRFFRGANVSQSTIPGSGLGLSVVEKIICLHQGQATVQSALGQGSTFRIWLPVHCTEGSQGNREDR